MNLLLLAFMYGPVCTYKLLFQVFMFQNNDLNMFGRINQLLLLQFLKITSYYVKEKKKRPGKQVWIIKVRLHRGAHLCAPRYKVFPEI